MWGGGGKEAERKPPGEKILEFRKYVGPLIVGAGLTPKNVYEQLSITDGAIVGSAFKPRGDTSAPVEKHLVRAFMDEVRRVRESSQTL